MTYVRDAVQGFAEEMEAKLREHDDNKPGWLDDSPRDLLNRLTEEMYELAEELYNVPLDRDKVISEAADVANYAFFIYDVIQRSSLV